MKPLQTAGANGLPFDKSYWDDMYIEDEESVIDGIYNAENHAGYICELLKLFEISVHSLGDFGFGLGVLLREFISVLKPGKIIAIDPSGEAVNRLIQQKWVSSLNIAVKQSSIEAFEVSYLEKEPLDLIICNSVLQYLPEKDIPGCFDKLSRICKYLYITIPTSTDYKFMKKVLNFTDPYAYSRSRSFYTRNYKKYFTCVSHNLLESKRTVKESPILFDLFKF